MLFVFESPALLQLLWGILVLYGLILFAYWQWRQRTLRQLGSPALEARLLQGFSVPRFWIKNALFMGAAALVVVAMANPRVVVRVVGTPQQSADVLIALDVSNSMVATDLSPSRLDKAKTFVEDLVNVLDGERLGLLFFAGDAQAQAPLSTDYGALLMFTRNATPAFIADQGTDVANAIEQALRMVESDAQRAKALILISDGEYHQGDAIKSAQKARAAGMQIHTIGAGSIGGGTIQDAFGNPLRTALNEPFLRQIAQVGGGNYYHLSQDKAALQAMRTAVANLPKTTVEAQAHNDYHSYYQWLLIPALLLLIGEQLLWWRKPR